MEKIRENLEWPTSCKFVERKIEENNVLMRSKIVTSADVHRRWSSNEHRFDTWYKWRIHMQIKNLIIGTCVSLYQNSYFILDTIMHTPERE
jgi:hypothetical protein